MPRNEELRKQVYELRAKGLSKAAVARQAGCSRQRVGQLLSECSPFEVDLRPMGRIVLYNSQSEEGSNNA